ncbi:MAG: hypothetical protein V3573_14480 [Desulfovibrionaceae bacterium]
MKNILENVIEPALRVLPPMMTSDRARAQLLAVQAQEDPEQVRRQIAGYRKDGTIIHGPAKGLWQFERTGVQGVLRHPRTRDHAKGVCWKLGNAGTVASVYHQLEHDDVLAACFARLNLWWLRGTLPGPGAAEEGWRQYLEAWNPGRPHPETWPGNFRRAWEVVGW